MNGTYFFLPLRAWPTGGADGGRSAGLGGTRRWLMDGFADPLALGIGREGRLVRASSRCLALFESFWGSGVFMRKGREREENREGERVDSCT